jgi:hypothetical protein
MDDERDDRDEDDEVEVILALSIPSPPWFVYPPIGTVFIVGDKIDRKNKVFNIYGIGPFVGVYAHPDLGWIGSVQTEQGLISMGEAQYVVAYDWYLSGPLEGFRLIYQPIPKPYRFDS